MDATYPNWVAERAACDVDVLFKQLVEIMTSDLERLKTTVNESIAHAESNGKDALTINWMAGFPCRLTLYSDRVRRRISVRRDDYPTHECYISTRWDAEKYRCYVVVKPGEPEASDPIEFPYKHLWKVNRHILEPVFFPRST